MRHVALTVNGVGHELELEPRELLVYVLRDRLRLTGTNVGCDTSSCGACTVLVDGESVKSCTMLGVQADGTEITTIEGLATDGELHPVQQAWIDEQVPQCGYCQSGMMIAAVVLLARNPDPSVAEIKDAFTNTPSSPHLCRCGTYPAIIDAVQRAAKAMRA